MLFARATGGKSWSKSARRRASDISSQARRRRLEEGGLHVNEPALFGVFHGVFKFVWNPGIIGFDDELGDLRAFGLWQLFNLLDNFVCAHGSKYPRKRGIEQGEKNSSGTDQAADWPPPDGGKVSAPAEPAVPPAG